MLPRRLPWRLGGPQAEPRAAVRHVSQQEAAALLSKPKPMLSERQRKIVEFLKQTADFATMRHLVLSFRSILLGSQVASLKRWIEKAEAAGIEGMRRFVRQLKKDMEAVENAVKEVWSNGPDPHFPIYAKTAYITEYRSRLTPRRRV